MAARGGTPHDFGRAAAEILQFNPLGEVCGIVCPDTFCMDACARATFDKPIEIPKVQAAIISEARKHKTIPVPAKLALNGKKVAVIGAGPAGLAATGALARLGYEISLFEADAVAGGACLTIPDPRLPKNALQEDAAYVMSLGTIHAHFGKKIEKPAELLKQGFHAVVIAAGQPDPIKLGLPGEDLAVTATDYLKNPKKFSFTGNVAIIGGGAVAADCATTARHQGATEVEMFIRRTLFEMRLTSEERRMLLEAQVNVTTRTKPAGITRETGGKLTLETTKAETGAKLPRPGYDLIISAVGNTYNGAPLSAGVFLAGDCTHGASTVVESVASGKNAAHAVDRFLGGQYSLKITEESRPLKTKWSIAKSYNPLQGLDKLPVDLTTDFFGRKISSPFLLSAAPHTDGFNQMKKAYKAGWVGGVMKTAFDDLPIHIPAGYMVQFDPKTYGNADNVSGHSLNRVCGEIEKLRKLFPTHLTMGSTGGPVTGNDAEDCKVWQSNTRKLENAGALAVEYSLSCPQGGDGTEGDIVSQKAAVTAKVIDWVMQTSAPDVPKLFKLSAAVTSIKPILRAVKSVFDKYPHKKGGITLANSFPVMAFRPSKNPSARWEEGLVVGMSGQGVLPISYLTLADAASFGITVSGNGGVMDYHAAANFLALGARSVQVCTVVMKHGLGVIHELNQGLSFLLHARGIRSVEELIGRAHPKAITPFMELTPLKQVSQVRPNFCQSCGNCTNCPYLAIKLDEHKHPVTDPSLCVGCSWCANACFSGALFMRDRSPEELAALKE